MLLREKLAHLDELARASGASTARRSIRLRAMLEHLRAEAARADAELDAAIDRAADTDSTLDYLTSAVRAHFARQTGARLVPLIEDAEQAEMNAAQGRTYERGEIAARLDRLADARGDIERVEAAPNDVPQRLVDELLNRALAAGQEDFKESVAFLVTRGLWSKMDLWRRRQWSLPGWAGDIMCQAA